jgi:hypothetical protein
LVLCTDTQKAVYDSSATSLCGGKDYIGGCNGVSACCEGSEEYNDAKAFSALLPGATKYWTFTITGPGNEVYYCLNYWKDSTGAIVLSLGISPSLVDPVNSSSCMSSRANACVSNHLNPDGTCSDGSGTSSGIATKSGTGIAGICIDPTTGAYINCPTTKTDTGDGTSVTQDGATGRAISSDGTGTVTGDSGMPSGTILHETSMLCTDSNKDGFDDTTGVPCGSAGSSIGKTGSLAGCTDLNKDGLDDITKLPCITDESGESKGFNLPSIGEFDTKTETVPEDDYKGLISSFLSNHPFISIIRNTGIKTESATCKISGEVLGKTMTLDFCPLQSVINIFGIAFVGICTIRSFFIAFGVGE